MGSINSGALPQRELGRIKSGGAAATKNGQDKKRGRCRNENWAKKAGRCRNEKLERKRVVEGKSVELGGSRMLKKKNRKKKTSITE